jgi:hypothetical protein
MRDRPVANLAAREPFLGRTVESQRRLDREDEQERGYRSEWLKNQFHAA